MPRVHSVPLWQRAVILLSGTVVGLVILLGLQWGRPVLIPIALAVLLTFLLNPLVRALQRRGLGRVFSVMAAVSTAGLVLLCLGWMVTRQVTSLLPEIPQTTANIKAKVKTLRQLGSGPLAERFGQMVEEIGAEFQPPPPDEQATDGAAKKHEAIGIGGPAGTVLIRSESTPWLSLTGYLGSALEVLATLAFTLVLLVFFLLGREDLRDRLVMVAGKTRLALTSKALEDVTDRISRYIAMVALVNGGFGVLLTAGLLWLQVPYALLWGFLAAGLRFIPYIGPWIGAVFPIAMSLATSEGWGPPLVVFGYVIVLELIGNNVVEPLVFGRSTGVSATALMISAAFWLYLWGPFGLVLSAPFAVCLVVLGKNIPQLGFLNLLLGDAPALNAPVGLYQRLILGDQHEVSLLVAQRMKGAAFEEVYDDLLIPALNYVQRDAQRDHLTEGDQRTVVEGMRAVLQQTDQLLPSSPLEQPDPGNLVLADHGARLPEVPQSIHILGCPAQDDLDGMGLEMLRQLLDPATWELEVTSEDTLASELAARIAESPPDVVCIAALPPGGMAHARYLCKRLRDASPDMPIIVGRWGPQRNRKLEQVRLEEAGASFVTTTLLETRRLLESRLPLLAREAPAAAASAMPVHAVGLELAAQAPHV